MMYEPFEPGDGPLTVQLDASYTTWSDGDWLRVEPGGRVRLVVEGLRERVQPYLEAVQVLAVQEPDSPLLREHTDRRPAIEGYVPGMREHRPELCWRLLEGAFCCILERGHDEGVHEL